jgi:crossover junction endodeoxyribonuclease RuvC
VIRVVVLGIDPGLRLTGYGAVRLASPRHTLVEAGVIRLTLIDKQTKAKATVSDRLAELDAEFRTLLDRLKPTAVGVEGLFAHAAHPATAMVMGHARGVLLLAIRQRNLRLVELKPRLVKKAMTGSGRAEKGQMQRVVQDYFGLAEAPSPPDVADALAIAVTTADQIGFGVSGDEDGPGGGAFEQTELAKGLAKRRRGARSR